jgi:hypothetical protein
VDKKRGRGRPLAEDFHYAIVNQKDFIQIKKITQVQPGDIIAIKYIPDNDSKTKDNTGHVMLVVEPPKKRNKQNHWLKKNSGKSWLLTKVVRGMVRMIRGVNDPDISMMILN